MNQADTAAIWSRFWEFHILSVPKGTDKIFIDNYYV